MQDTGSVVHNQLYSYTLAMKILKMKLLKYLYLPYHQKNKTLNNKFDQKKFNVYSESYKILLKEIKLSKYVFKKSRCSSIGRLTIVKIAVLPISIYRLMQSLPESKLLCRKCQLILEFIQNCKKPPIDKMILKK